jgi:hypothetical protein
VLDGVSQDSSVPQSGGAAPGDVPVGSDEHGPVFAEAVRFGEAAEVAEPGRPDAVAIDHDAELAFDLRGTGALNVT